MDNQQYLNQEALLQTRSAFIGKTYNHLFGAIALFTGIEVALFKSGMAQSIAEVMLGFSWFLILGLFMVVGYFATKVAATGSIQKQYAALGAYVVAEAIIFIPMLYMANNFAPGAIESAAVATLIGFTGLTALAHISKKDFSFLSVVIKWGFICAIVLIVTSLIFGFTLGSMFSVAMVLLAGCAILYDTSKIMFEYPEDRYVGASLQLFASVALMFWYLLSFFMNRDD